MKSLKILMVDDEPPVRELVALYFGAKGFEVITASSISEARQIIEDPNQDFSLAILDIDLESESGLDLIAPIKGQFPDIRVILFSGVELSTSEWEKARQEGANGYLRKTQPLGEMWVEVQRLLQPGILPIVG